MQDLRRLFLKETAKTANSAAKTLSAERRKPSAIDDIVREMHSIKGMSGLLELPRLGGLAGAVEAALGTAPDAPADPGLVQALQAGFRRMADVAKASARVEPPGSDADVLGAMAIMSGLAARLQPRRLTAAGKAPRPPRQAPGMWSVREALAHLEEHAVDLAASAGKKIDFRLQAVPAQVEAEIIAALVPTAIQLVRNAIAHGIETGPERIAAGKPAAGKVTLAVRRSSSKREGARLVIEVTDDGRGIDPGKVAAAASRIGYVTADQAKSVDLAAAHELIFLPGVSTARASRRLAGRGIGLDAARARLTALGGSIAVSSRPGKGTTFSVTLPLAVRRSRPGSASTSTGRLVPVEGSAGRALEMTT